jgi:hypothetical protein
MATTKKRPPAWVVVLSIIDLVFLVLFLTILFFSRPTQLLWHGVPAQGTIIGAQATNCSKTFGVEYAVRFTDRVGQAYTATFRSCDYGSPANLSPGDAIAILYLPDNPTVIAPPAPLPSQIQFGVDGIIFFSFCQLLILGIWIGSRLRRSLVRTRRRQDRGMVSRATNGRETPGLSRNFPVSSAEDEEAQL